LIVNELQAIPEYGIHGQHNKSYDNGGSQDDHGRLLQLGPGRPAHFIFQFLVRIPEVERDLIHFFRFENLKMW
jgi:hypothetical protein